MTKRPERIGVMGGTFDPIHIGHLFTAVAVRHELGLDRVLVIPNNAPWQKVEDGREVSSAEDRLAIVEACVAELDGVEASDIEIERGGMTYTADTLEQLRDENPHAELFLIVGADVELSTWKRVEVIQQLATLAVVNRPDHDIPDLGWGWRVETVTIPGLDVSSTEIRRRVREGEPIKYLTPDAAIHEIEQRRLYR